MTETPKSQILFSQSTLRTTVILFSQSTLQQYMPQELRTEAPPNHPPTHNKIIHTLPESGHPIRAFLLCSRNDVQTHEATFLADINHLKGKDKKSSKKSVQILLLISGNLTIGVIK